MCIYGFPEAIFKMSAMENDKNPKFRYFFVRFICHKFTIVTPMYAFESDKSYLIKQKKPWCSSVKLSEAKIAGNHE